MEKKYFKYDYDEAARIIKENISNELKDKLSTPGILTVLGILDEYFINIGLLEENENEISESESLERGPICIEFEELYHFILSNAIQHDIFLTFEEVEEFMDAEEIYLSQNGMIESQIIE